MANTKWVQIKNDRDTKDTVNVLKVSLNENRTCSIKFGKKIIDHMKAKKGEAIMVFFNPNNLYEFMVCKNYDTGYKLGLENPHMPNSLLKINFKLKGKASTIAPFPSRVCEYVLSENGQVIITLRKGEDEDE